MQRSKHWRAGCGGILLLLCCSPAWGTEQIIINVAAGTNIGAGFGELTPGPHDLRITLQATEGTIDPWSTSVWEQTGLTMWTLATMKPPVISRSIKPSRLFRHVKSA